MEKRFTLNKALENKEFIQELDTLNPILENCFNQLIFKDKYQFFSLLKEERMKNQLLNMLDHIKNINLNPSYRIQSDTKLVTDDNDVLWIFELLLGIIYPITDLKFGSKFEWTEGNNDINHFNYLNIIPVIDYNLTDQKLFNLKLSFENIVNGILMNINTLDQVSLRCDYKGKDQDNGLRINHSDLQRATDPILNDLKNICIEIIKEQL